MSQSDLKTPVPHTTGTEVTPPSITRSIPAVSNTNVTHATGQTQVTYQTKRYTFPRQAVQALQDNNAEPRADSMCVMFDMGLQCPFCTGAFSASFSATQRRVAPYSCRQHLGQICDGSGAVPSDWQQEVEASVAIKNTPRRGEQLTITDTRDFLEDGSPNKNRSNRSSMAEDKGSQVPPPVPPRTGKHGYPYTHVRSASSPAVPTHGYFNVTSPSFVTHTPPMSPTSAYSYYDVPSNFQLQVSSTPVSLECDTPPALPPKRAKRTISLMDYSSQKDNTIHHAPRETIEVTQRSTVHDIVLQPQYMSKSNKSNKVPPPIPPRCKPPSGVSESKKVSVRSATVALERPHSMVQATKTHKLTFSQEALSTDDSSGDVLCKSSTTCIEQTIRRNQSPLPKEALDKLAAGHQPLTRHDLHLDEVPLYRKEAIYKSRSREATPTRMGCVTPIPTPPTPPKPTVPPRVSSSTPTSPPSNPSNTNSHIQHSQHPGLGPADLEESMHSSNPSSYFADTSNYQSVLMSPKSDPPITPPLTDSTSYTSSQPIDKWSLRMQRAYSGNAQAPDQSIHSTKTTQVSSNIHGSSTQTKALTIDESDIANPPLLKVRKQTNVQLNNSGNIPDTRQSLSITEEPVSKNLTSQSLVLTNNEQADGAFDHQKYIISDNTGTVPDQDVVLVRSITKTSQKMETSTSTESAQSDQEDVDIDQLVDDLHHLEDKLDDIATYTGPNQTKVIRKTIIKCNMTQENIENGTTPSILEIQPRPPSENDEFVQKVVLDEDLNKISTTEDKSHQQNLTDGSDKIDIELYDNVRNYCTGHDIRDSMITHASEADDEESMSGSLQGKHFLSVDDNLVNSGSSCETIDVLDNNLQYCYKYTSSHGSRETVTTMDDIVGAQHDSDIEASYTGSDHEDFTITGDEIAFSEWDSSCCVNQPPTCSEYSDSESSSVDEAEASIIMDPEDNVDEILENADVASFGPDATLQQVFTQPRAKKPRKKRMQILLESPILEGQHDHPHMVSSVDYQFTVGPDDNQNKHFTRDYSGLPTQCHKLPITQSAQDASNLGKIIVKSNEDIIPLTDSQIKARVIEVDVSHSRDVISQTDPSDFGSSDMMLDESDGDWNNKVIKLKGFERTQSMKSSLKSSADNIINSSSAPDRLEDTRSSSEYDNERCMKNVPTHDEYNISDSWPDSVALEKLLIPINGQEASHNVQPVEKVVHSPQRTITVSGVDPGIQEITSEPVVEVFYDNSETAILQQGVILEQSPRTRKSATLSADQSDYDATSSSTSGEIYFGEDGERIYSTSPMSKSGVVTNGKETQMATFDINVESTDINAINNRAVQYKIKTTQWELDDNIKNVIDYLDRNIVDQKVYSNFGDDMSSTNANKDADLIRRELLGNDYTITNHRNNKVQQREKRREAGSDESNAIMSVRLANTHPHNTSQTAEDRGASGSAGDNIIVTSGFFQDSQQLVEQYTLAPQDKHHREVPATHTDQPFAHGYSRSEQGNRNNSTRISANMDQPRRSSNVAIGSICSEIQMDFARIKIEDKEKSSVDHAPIISNPIVAEQSLCTDENMAVAENKNKRPSIVEQSIHTEFQFDVANKNLCEIENEKNKEISDTEITGKKRRPSVATESVCDEVLMDCVRPKKGQKIATETVCDETQMDNVGRKAAKDAENERRASVAMSSVCQDTPFNLAENVASDSNENYSEYKGKDVEAKERKTSVAMSTVCVDMPFNLAEKELSGDKPPVEKERRASLAASSICSETSLQVAGTDLHRAEINSHEVGAQNAENEMREISMSSNYVILDIPHKSGRILSSEIDYINEERDKFLWPELEPRLHAHDLALSSVHSPSDDDSSCEKTKKSTYVQHREQINMDYEKRKSANADEVIVNSNRNSIVYDDCQICCSGRLYQVPLNTAPNAAYEFGSSRHSLISNATPVERGMDAQSNIGARSSINSNESITHRTMLSDIADRRKRNSTLDIDRSIIPFDISSTSSDSEYEDISCQGHAHEDETCDFVSHMRSPSNISRTDDSTPQCQSRGHSERSFCLRQKAYVTEHCSTGDLIFAQRDSEDNLLFRVGSTPSYKFSESYNERVSQYSSSSSLASSNRDSQERVKFQNYTLTESLLGRTEATIKKEEEKILNARQPLSSQDPAEIAPLYIAPAVIEMPTNRTNDSEMDISQLSVFDLLSHVHSNYDIMSSEPQLDTILTATPKKVADVETDERHPEQMHRRSTIASPSNVHNEFFFDIETNSARTVFSKDKENEDKCTRPQLSHIPKSPTKVKPAMRLTHTTSDDTLDSHVNVRELQADDSCMTLNSGPYIVRKMSHNYLEEEIPPPITVDTQEVYTWPHTLYYSRPEIQDIPCMLELPEPTCESSYTDFALSPEEITPASYMCVGSSMTNVNDVLSNTENREPIPSVCAVEDNHPKIICVSDSAKISMDGMARSPSSEVTPIQIAGEMNIVSGVGVVRNDSNIADCSTNLLCTAPEQEGVGSSNEKVAISDILVQSPCRDDENITITHAKELAMAATLPAIIRGDTDINDCQTNLLSMAFEQDRSSITEQVSVRDRLHSYDCGPIQPVKTSVEYEIGDQQPGVVRADSDVNEVQMEMLSTDSEIKRIASSSEIVAVSYEPTDTSDAQTNPVTMAFEQDSIASTTELVSIQDELSSNDCGPIQPIKTVVEYKISDQKPAVLHADSDLNEMQINVLSTDSEIKRVASSSEIIAVSDGNADASDTQTKAVAMAFEQNSIASATELVSIGDELSSEDCGPIQPIKTVVEYNMSDAQLGFVRSDSDLNELQMDILSINSELRHVASASEIVTLIDEHSDVSKCQTTPLSVAFEQDRISSSIEIVSIADILSGDNCSPLQYTKTAFEYNIGGAQPGVVRCDSDLNELEVKMLSTASELKSIAYSSEIVALSDDHFNINDCQMRPICTAFEQNSISISTELVSIEDALKCQDSEIIAPTMTAVEYNMSGPQTGVLLCNSDLNELELEIFSTDSEIKVHASSSEIVPLSKERELESNVDGVPRNIDKTAGKYPLPERNWRVTEVYTDLNELSLHLTSRSYIRRIASASEIVNISDEISLTGNSLEITPQKLATEYHMAQPSVGILRSVSDVSDCQTDLLVADVYIKHEISPLEVVLATAYNEFVPESISMVLHEKTLTAGVEYAMAEENSKEEINSCGFNYYHFEEVQPLMTTVDYLISNQNCDVACIDTPYHADVQADNCFFVRVMRDACVIEIACIIYTVLEDNQGGRCLVFSLQDAIEYDLSTNTNIVHRQLDIANFKEDSVYLAAEVTVFPFRELLTNINFPHLYSVDGIKQDVLYVEITKTLFHMTSTDFVTVTNQPIINMPKDGDSHTESMHTDDSIANMKVSIYKEVASSESMLEEVVHREESVALLSIVEEFKNHVVITGWEIVLITYELVIYVCNALESNLLYADYTEFKEPPPIILETARPLVSSIYTFTCSSLATSFEPIADAHTISDIISPEITPISHNPTLAMQDEFVHVKSEPNEIEVTEERQPVQDLIAKFSLFRDLEKAEGSSESIPRYSKTPELAIAQPVQNLQRNEYIPDDSDEEEYRKLPVLSLVAKFDHPVNKAQQKYKGNEQSGVCDERLVSTMPIKSDNMSTNIVLSHSENSTLTDSGIVIDQLSPTLQHEMTYARLVIPSSGTVDSHSQNCSKESQKKHEVTEDIISSAFNTYTTSIARNIYSSSMLQVCHQYLSIYSKLHDISLPACDPTFYTHVPTLTSQSTKVLLHVGKTDSKSDHEMTAFLCSVLQNPHENEDIYENNICVCLGKHIQISHVYMCEILRGSSTNYHLTQMDGCTPYSSLYIDCKDHAYTSNASDNSNIFHGVTSTTLTSNILHHTADRENSPEGSIDMDHNLVSTDDSSLGDVFDNCSLGSMDLADFDELADDASR